LILGKFILIGKVIKVGERVRHDVLLRRILWKSLATMPLLAIFTMVEDLLTGLLTRATSAGFRSEEDRVSRAGVRRPTSCFRIGRQTTVS
jgi:hypothetical protein